MIQTNRNIVIPQAVGPEIILINPLAKIINVQYPQELGECIISIKYSIDKSDVGLAKDYRLVTNNESWDYSRMHTELLKLEDFDGATLI